MLQDIEWGNPEELTPEEIEHLKNSSKKGSFIAKMVTTALLTLGIAGVAVGATMGHQAKTANPTQYENDTKYNVGIVTMTLGGVSSALGAGGVAGLISSKHDEERVKHSEL